jgi:ankyrin repeat protein
MRVKRPTIAALAAIALAAAPALALSPACRLDYQSPLLDAIADRNTPEIARLLAEGADPNSVGRSPYGSTTALALTIRGSSRQCGTLKPDEALFRMLLAAGADPKRSMPLSYRGEGDALQAAADARATGIAIAAIEAGVPTDARSTTGKTALHLALDARAEDVVHVLLARGADPNAVMMHQGKPYWTPLHQAARWPGPRNRVARALVEHGAVYRSLDGDEPMGQLAQFLREADAVDELIQIFVQAGGQVDGQGGKDVQTPLTLGLRSTHAPLAVFEALLRQGADPNRGALYALVDRTDFENVPLKRRQLLELLVRHGAKMDQTHSSYRQPLLPFAQSRNPLYAAELRGVFGSR